MELLKVMLAAAVMALAAGSVHAILYYMVNGLRLPRDLLTQTVIVTFMAFFLGFAAGL